MRNLLYLKDIAGIYKTALLSPPSQYTAAEWETLILTLLSEILKLPKHTLPFTNKKKLSVLKYWKLSKALRELREGLPLGYILKETVFCNLKFYTPRGVFLPRVETEELTYKLINVISKQLKTQVKTKKPFSLLDIGTGSGVMAIVLKKQFPELAVTAIDGSTKAISTARKNARQLLPSTPIKIYKKMLWQHPSALENLEKYNFIISNPPYIGTNDPALSEKVLHYEPHTALFSGEDGLMFFRKLSKHLPKWLHKNGLFYFEFGHNQHHALKHLFSHYDNVQFHKDLFGKYRFISGMYS